MTYSEYERERQRLLALAHEGELSYWDAESAIAAIYVTMSDEDRRTARMAERESAAGLSGHGSDDCP